MKNQVFWKRWNHANHCIHAVDYVSARVRRKRRESKKQEQSIKNNQNSVSKKWCKKHWKYMKKWWNMEPKVIKKRQKSMKKRGLKNDWFLNQFLLIFWGKGFAYLPSVRQVNCRKTTERKRKRKEKGTVQDREHWLRILTRDRLHSRPGADFSISLWGVEKSIKIGPWGAQGTLRPPESVTESAASSIEGIRGKYIKDYR